MHHSFMSPGESLGAFMGPLTLEKKYFCIYICVCFSSVKSEWFYSFVD